MVILGIDPGTHRVGYGLIESTPRDCHYIAAGLLPLGRKDPPLQLFHIRQEVASLIRTFTPRGMALEKLYFTKNQKTAMDVAQARGAILLTAAEYSLPVAEFGPREVKTHLTGYGSADKTAILKMVRICLHYPSLRLIDDASDALALALAAHFTKQFRP